MAKGGEKNRPFHGLNSEEEIRPGGRKYKKSLIYDRLETQKGRTYEEKRKRLTMDCSPYGRKRKKKSVVEKRHQEGMKANDSALIGKGERKRKDFKNGIFTERNRGRGKTLV